MTVANQNAQPAIETYIPARPDRLPWSRFHWLIVIALGVTWILDGLEVTLKGAISGVLQEPGTLHLTPAEIGAIASFYLTGAVLGSLFFGWLTDRFGRRLMFFVTLGVYLSGALLTAFSWDFWSFCLFRVITGAGIGGEYAAINSAIDELIPARLRGRIDIFINGSYWVGAALGSGSTLILLNTNIFSVDVGWRVGLGVGAVLGLFILLVRRHVPESPRWLLTHGYEDEAERAVGEIEARVQADTGRGAAALRQERRHYHPSATGLRLRRGGAHHFRRISQALAGGLCADGVASVSL
ncbi:MAG TPA: MFS transporter [Pseudolabrys sp.]|nr:MFS transporter [Pseudolabrys sp.]